MKLDMDSIAEALKSVGVREVILYEGPELRIEFASDYGTVKMTNSDFTENGL